MKWILVLLIFVGPQPEAPSSAVSVVAEFNTREACNDATHQIARPLDDQFAVRTQAACVAKGTEGFGG